MSKVYGGSFTQDENGWIDELTRFPRGLLGELGPRVLSELAYENPLRRITPHQVILARGAEAEPGSISRRPAGGTR